MKFHHFSTPDKSFWIPLEKSTMGPHLEKILPTPVVETCLLHHNGTGNNQAILFQVTAQMWRLQRSKNKRPLPFHSIFYDTRQYRGNEIWKDEK